MQMAQNMSCVVSCQGVEGCERNVLLQSITVKYISCKAFACERKPTFRIERQHAFLINTCEVKIRGCKMFWK